MSAASTKVTSGGKHLGNIHKEANGTHTAVTKVGGTLQSHNFQSHQGALNHIRKAHGLPGISAKKAAPSTPPASAPHMPGMGLASPKKTTAKKAASPSTPVTLADKKAKALYASEHANKVQTPEAHKLAEQAHKAVVDHATSMGMHTTASTHMATAVQHHSAAKALTAPKKTAAPSAPAHAFASWDAEHGSGGGGVSSADKIAAGIRGALGPGKMDAPKVESKTGKSGSTISRAEASRSVASHVLKKDMKRPAPVKGEKDAADAFRTKIRMAAYNEKKKQAAAADPVNKMTPKTEQVVNPHDKPHAEAAKVATEKAFAHPTVENHKAAEKAVLAAAKEAAASGNASGASHWTKLAMLHGKHADELSKSSPASSSADKIAAMIKGTHAEQHGKTPAPAAKKVAAAAPKAEESKVEAPKHTVPELRQQTHAPGSSEDAANKADEATRLANENPSYVNHQKAYEAHTAALNKLSTAKASPGMFKARDYHTMMQGYHRFAADHPGKVIPAGVKEEHTDKLADRLPQASAHQMHTAFTDTNSRRHSQQMYEALTKAGDTKLTAGQKSSIGAYTGSGYTTINTYHRKVVNGNEHMSADSQAYAQKHTANLDAAFAKQPALEHDLVTYRGVRNANTMFGQVGERVGGEFIDHGYTSTASHAAVGSGFGGGTAGATAENNTLVRVLHPAGSKVLKPSGVGSFNDSEREILTPRGTRYHIAADRVVTLQNGRTQRQVDLIRK